MNPIIVVSHYRPENNFDLHWLNIFLITIAYAEYSYVK